MADYNGFRFGSKDNKDPHKNSFISLTEGTVADGNHTVSELETGSKVIGYFTDMDTRTLYCIFGLAVGKSTTEQVYDQEYKKIHLVKWIGTPHRMPSEYWNDAVKSPGGNVSVKVLEEWFNYFINK